MLRVPVLSKSGKPLMPTKASRARRWLEEGKAKVVHNDLECFAVQLTVSSREDLQPVAVGLDPGKLYSGIGVQSSRATLWMAHLILPFKTVKDRMEARRIIRRARRGRRINRKIPYNIRKWLGLAKDKKNKADQTPATHAVDGVTLAAFEFIRWREWHSGSNKHGSWKGDVQITPAPFATIRRPPVARRQLHLCVPSKGGKRRKYGGTITRHGIRKGDKVIAEKAGKVYTGWCSGDTKTKLSVSDCYWKRIGQFTAKKVQLLQRSTGLIVVPSTGPVKPYRIERFGLTWSSSPSCFAELGVSRGLR
ncbi:MAG: RRXRR domain-containing protein [Coleofasciculus sp. C1-SOL-03]